MLQIRGRSIGFAARAKHLQLGLRGPAEFGTLLASGVVGEGTTLYVVLGGMVAALTALGVTPCRGPPTSRPPAEAMAPTCPAAAARSATTDSGCAWRSTAGA